MQKREIEKSDGEGNIIKVPNPDIFEDDGQAEYDIPVWQRTSQKKVKIRNNKNTHLTPKKKKRK